MWNPFLIGCVYSRFCMHPWKPLCASFEGNITVSFPPSVWTTSSHSPVSTCFPITTHPLDPQPSLSITHSDRDCFYLSPNTVASSKTRSNGTNKFHKKFTPSVRSAIRTTTLVFSVVVGPGGQRYVSVKQSATKCVRSSRCFVRWLRTITVGKIVE